MRTINKSRSRAYSYLAAEFIFILLPFVVIAITFAIKGDLSHLFYTAEWSIAAAILMGQALVKFTSGFLATRENFKAHWERVALTMAIVMVVGIVPTLLILGQVLSDPAPKTGLAIAQVIFFGVGVAAFFILGGIGETMIRIPEESSQTGEEEKNRK